MIVTYLAKLIGFVAFLNELYFEGREIASPKSQQKSFDKLMVNIFLRVFEALISYTNFS